MRLAPLAILPLLAACVAEDPAPPSGAMMFAENCAACHGPGGTGSLALGLDLTPPAPDLTGLAARNGGTFPRDFVLSTIDGYAGGQHTGRIMPEFGATDMGNLIIVENPDGTGTPIPERLLALSDYLASIQN